MGSLKKSIISVVMLCSTWTCLFSLELGSDINLIGGYRYDTLDRKNIIKFVPPEVSQIDKIRIDNINLGEVGINGRLMMPRCFSWYDDYSFLNNFYLHGFAKWGWGGKDAKLHEDVVDIATGERDLGRAVLKNVHTADYQIALGYLLEYECWGIGVSGGYAYDRQKIASKHGKTAFPASSPLINDPIYSDGYKTITTWQGPWVGGELFYQMCEWNFGLGYEYHFATYRANHSIPNNPIAQAEGLADKAGSSNATGNVVYFDGYYQFCGGWQAELCFKYQNYFASHGHLKPAHGTFADLGFPDTTIAHATGRWTSFSATLDLGYAF